VIVCRRSRVVSRSGTRGAYADAGLQTARAYERKSRETVLSVGGDVGSCLIARRR
jgi:hypothetical protein